MKKKHILMLQTFIKVMLDSKKEIKAIIPDSYYPSIYDINYEELSLKHVNALLFDVDNTIALVDDLNVPDKTIQLFDSLKKKKFKILLLSNNNEQRVKPIAEKLNIPMLANIGKPESKAYSQALKLLNSKKENAAAIGDQLLSDIIGAKKYGIHGILVDQLSKKNNFQTGMAQKLQHIIIKKLAKCNLFKQKSYYH